MFPRTAFLLQEFMRIMFWLSCLFLCAIFLTVTIIYLFLIPAPNLISSNHTCIWNESGAGFSCKRKVEVQRELEKSVEEAVANHERLEELSKAIPRIIRYDVKIINRTKAGFELNNPPRKRETSEITCADFPSEQNHFNFDDTILEYKSVAYSELVPLLKKLPTEIFSCTFDLQSRDLDGDVDLNGDTTITLNFQENYLFKAKPDITSWVVVFLVSLLATIGLLPVIKQAVRFAVKGPRKYFVAGD